VFDLMRYAYVLSNGEYVSGKKLWTIPTSDKKVCENGKLMSCLINENAVLVDKRRQVLYHMICAIFSHLLNMKLSKVYYIYFPSINLKY